MSSYDYLNGYDPAFWDESDMVECDTCGERFDHNEYASDTCVDCEDKLMEERAKNEQRN